MDLDDLDWRILEHLQQDGRMTFTELARRVNLSAPATTERVRRLEQLGVITGYAAVVDPAARPAHSGHRPGQGPEPGLPEVPGASAGPAVGVRCRPRDRRRLLAAARALQVHG